MAQQQPPARPWFRLASMSRPAAPTPTPAPAPAPAQAPQPAPPTVPQPRPQFVRPAFVQPFVTQPAQPPPPAPQETTPAPPPATVTVSSVPSSPVKQEPPTTSTTFPIASSSVPSSPKSRVSAPPSPTPKLVLTSPVAWTAPPPTVTSSSVPTSPVIKTATPISSPKQSTSTTFPISYSSVPPSPKKIISSPTSSLPTSPASKPVAPTPAPPPSPVLTTTVTTRLLTPIAQASPPPAKTKPLSPPPSPLKLPSAQLKSDVEPIEQKTVLVQETIEKPKVVPRTSTGDPQRRVGESHSAGGKGLNGKRDVIKGNGDYPKKLSDSDEFGMRIITIAGDNKGAIMELSSPSSNKKHAFGANPQTLNKKGNEGEKSGSATSSGGEEGSLKSKDRSMAASPPPKPLNTFTNSNVQGVNNSILFNTDCTHHDPGVHISLSRKASGNGIHIKERKVG